MTDEASCWQASTWWQCQYVKTSAGNNNELSLVPVGLTDQGVGEGGDWYSYERILLLFMIQVFPKRTQVLLVSVPAHMSTHPSLMCDM